MKKLFQEKISKKLSKKEIERVQLGIEIMQIQFQLMGY